MHVEVKEELEKEKRGEERGKRWRAEGAKQGHGGERGAGRKKPTLLKTASREHQIGEIPTIFEGLWLAPYLTPTRPTQELGDLGSQCAVGKTNRPAGQILPPVNFFNCQPLAKKGSRSHPSACSWFVSRSPLLTWFANWDPTGDTGASLRDGHRASLPLGRWHRFYGNAKNGALALGRRCPSSPQIGGAPRRGEPPNFQLG